MKKETKTYILQSDILLPSGKEPIHREGEEVTMIGDGEPTWGYYKFKNGDKVWKDTVENNLEWFLKKKEEAKPTVTYIKGLDDNDVIYDIFYHGEGSVYNVIISKERLAEILVAESKNLLVIADSGNEHGERGFTEGNFWTDALVKEYGIFLMERMPEWVGISLVQEFKAKKGGSVK